MIRPWYCSRLFWFGVPGLAFLLWLWADSENSSTYYSFRWKTPSYRGFGIGCQHGQIGGWIGRPYQGFANPGSQTGSYSYRGRIDKSRRDQINKDGPWWYEWESRSKDRLGFSVDCWLLVLAYVITWLASLLGWQRWKRRLSARQLPAA
jgi:hypothetical protein